MLQVISRGSLERSWELSAQEDRALRDAFGRWPEGGARQAGAAVVRAYQRLGAGHWFACDCLSSNPPPALVPVSESHIRRHHEPPWPEHDPDCDFFRDHLEQRAITRSFARKRDGRPGALVGRIGETEGNAGLGVTGRSYARSRGALATTLMRLIDGGRLNVVSEDGRPASISEQFKAMRFAARDVLIDEGVRLSEYLCTYLPALPELMAKIAAAPTGRFRATGRPHGVLIFVVADAVAGVLQPLRVRIPRHCGQ